MPLTVKNGVLVLSGYGVRVAVERGHLSVEDGVGCERRVGRLSRATSKLRRLVVLGHSGTISFEALRWLSDLGAAFLQIDLDGEVIAATAPLGLDDPRLRRAQALATANGVGIGIARNLLTQKLRGQVNVLEQIPESESAQANVNEALKGLAGAETVEQLRALEARAAAAYWQAWSALEVPWARKDLDRVPEHWRTVGSRTSPITASPRSASNPANALLNYLYAILEAEARIAILSIGLDPGMGVLHADLKARDSLALDVMEPIRPEVDRFVLELLRSHTFAAREFFETRQGVCRVVPSLTHQLAEMTPRWTKAIAPVAEATAQAFLRSRSESGDQIGKLANPLTEANRRTVREPTKRKGPKAGMSSGLSLARACHECGLVLDDPSRKYCDTCYLEQRKAVVANFANAGPASLARRREGGTDPAHTEAARRKQGLRAVENIRAIRDWEQENGLAEPAFDFERDILPKLQSVPLSRIMQATGLSLRYCSLIRRREKIPHQRHCEALARLCEQY